MRSSELVYALFRMGQLPSSPPNVSGWPHNSAWLDSNHSAARLLVGTEIGAWIDELPLGDELRSVAGRPADLTAALIAPLRSGALVVGDRVGDRCCRPARDHRRGVRRGLHVPGGRAVMNHPLPPDIAPGGFSRRRFLSLAGAAAAVGGLGAAGYAAGDRMLAALGGDPTASAVPGTGTDRILVSIQLEGGLDFLDTVIPVNDRRYQTVAGPLGCRARPGPRSRRRVRPPPEPRSSRRTLARR